MVINILKVCILSKTMIKSLTDPGAECGALRQEA